MFGLFYRKLIHPIVSSHDSPEAIAGGAALGLGIALTPTVGIQMPIAWLVATCCGANRVIAMAAVWISNPATVPFIYYSEYLLGCRLLDYESINSYNSFMAHWYASAEFGALEQIKRLSATVGYPLLVGSAVPALVSAILAFPITLYSVRWYRGRRTITPPVEPQASVGAKPPVDSKSKATGTGAILLFLLSLGCTDPNHSPFSSPELPEESELSGSVPMHASTLDDGTLLIFTALQSAPRHEAFVASALARDLQLDPDDHLFAQLLVCRFEADGAPRDFGEGGIPVQAKGRQGITSSLPPSTLLREGLSARARPLLASMLGAGKLPDPRGGRLSILVVFESQQSFEELSEVEVILPHTRVVLEPGSFDAVEFDRFLNSPGRDQFTQGFKATR